MTYENIISIVLFAYLNIELAFIPTIKYSLAIFSFSCQLSRVCKQQVRSESVFPALLSMYKYSARRQRSIFLSQRREAVCSEICRITWIFCSRSSSIVQAFAVWFWFVSLVTGVCWYAYSCLQLIKQMASLCYRVIDANPLIMACCEVSWNRCQSLKFYV